MDKPLLFSLTKKDFIVETFRSGGAGGQNQNKRDTGVRIRHPDSGAVASSRNHRTQLQNRKEAFRRLIDSDKFKVWHSIKCGKILKQGPSIDEQVDEMMSPENLKIETKNENGDWENE